MTKIAYVTFMKHAMKLTTAKGIASRPVLQGVIHRDDYVAATDSHRLYIAREMHEGSEKNVNPKTGAEITDSTYPDVLRLIPDSPSISVLIDVDIANKVAKLIEQANKIDGKAFTTIIDVGARSLALSSENDAACSVYYEFGEVTDRTSVYIDSKYLTEAFALFKDAGFTQVTFNYFGSPARPITLTAGNLAALLLPVKRA